MSRSLQSSLRRPQDSLPSRLTGRSRRCRRSSSGPRGRGRRGRAGGPHGLSEIIYAYASSVADNGSAFAGLNANTPWYNVTTGVAMFFGRLRCDASAKFDPTPLNYFNGFPRRSASGPHADLHFSMLMAFFTRPSTSIGFQWSARGGVGGSGVNLSRSPTAPRTPSGGLVSRLPPSQAGMKGVEGVRGLQQASRQDRAQGAA